MKNEAGQGIEANASSCDPSIVTRKEFVEKVVSKAVVAGTLIYGAAITESFIAPAARAATSGTQSVSTVTLTDLGVVTRTITDLVVRTSGITNTDFITKTNVVTTTVFTSSPFSSFL